MSVTDTSPEKCFSLLFFSLYSGLWPLQRALLQICVEREAPGASQGHSAS